MKTKTSLFFILVLIVVTCEAQVAISSDGSAAATSAMLELKSTTAGFLPPRMTTAERNLIASPASGLVIYNITTNCIEIYQTNIWIRLCGNTGSIANNADFTIGTGGTCSNTTISGSYETGTPLDVTNTVELEANITIIGEWSIVTDTVNGYSFSGNGIFSSTGIQLVTIYGTGIPIAAQPANFTAIANVLGGSCTFDVVTEFACGGQFIDNRDDQSYNTAQIGTQCWMAENLNIGTMIQSSTQQSDNSNIEKYCYNNDANNCETYGALYQWDEMMEYITTPGTQGICPAGWHVPTDEELCTLENFVDAGTVSCSTSGWRGVDAGGNLKESGTTHWISPNTGATNSSGFTLLGSGFCYPNSVFYDLMTDATLWSSSEDGSYAWERYFYHNHTDILRNITSKNYGFSVRCIKD